MKHFWCIHYLVNIMQLYILKCVLKLQNEHYIKENYLYLFLVKYYGFGAAWSGHWLRPTSAYTLTYRPMTTQHILTKRWDYSMNFSYIFQWMGQLVLLITSIINTASCKHVHIFLCQIKISGNQENHGITYLPWWNIWQNKRSHSLYRYWSTVSIFITWKSTL